MPKVMRATPELTSMPTRPSSSPSSTIASDLATEPCASTTAAIRPSTSRLKYSTAVNLSASIDNGTLRTRDHDRRHRAGKERGDGGNGERRSGLALLGHLVTVDTGDDRRRLARHVDQDGGGRAAILRAVEDAGQHDHALRRRQAEGEGQQQRHRRDRPDAGQHADRGADDHADQAEQQIVEFEGRRKAHQQIVEELHVRPCPARPDRDRQGQQLDEQQHRGPRKHDGKRNVSTAALPAWRGWR